MWICTAVSVFTTVNQWALPYSTMSRLVFLFGWMNIAAAIGVHMYVLAFKRREVQQRVTGVEVGLSKKEISIAASEKPFSEIPISEKPTSKKPAVETSAEETTAEKATPKEPTIEENPAIQPVQEKQEPRLLGFRRKSQTAALSDFCQLCLFLS